MIIVMFKNPILAKFVARVSSKDPDNELECLNAVITLTTINIGPNVPREKENRTTIDRRQYLPVGA